MTHAIKLRLLAEAWEAEAHARLQERRTYGESGAVQLRCAQQLRDACEGLPDDHEVVGELHPSRRYHAYIDHMESTLHEDVIADSHPQAAALAAQKTGVAGQWTVLNAQPVAVDIIERTEYVAKL